MEVTLDIETAPADNLDEYIKTIETQDLAKWENQRIECKRAGEKAPNKPKLRSKKAGLHWVSGKVCCISMMDIGSADVEAKAGSNEAELLDWACGILAEDKPKLFVTFNGLEFDLPFLIMRSAVNEVPMKELLPKINTKYSNRHIDIMQSLSKWKITASLEDFAFALGCHNLLYGNGDQVEGWYNEGQFKEIEMHNIADVRTTACVFKKLRWAL